MARNLDLCHCSRCEAEREAEQEVQKERHSSVPAFLKALVSWQDALARLARGESTKVRKDG